MMASIPGDRGSALIGNDKALDQYAEYAHRNSDSEIFDELVSPPMKCRPNHERRRFSYERSALNSFTPAGLTESLST